MSKQNGQPVIGCVFCGKPASWIVRSLTKDGFVYVKKSRPFIVISKDGNKFYAHDICAAKKAQELKGGN